MNQQKRLFQSIYVAIFFAQGALIPYMALFFSQDRFDLSPSEVGTIVAILPILSIGVQPLWGMLADRTGRVRAWLVLAMVGAAALSLTFLFATAYVWIVLLMVAWSVFQCAHIPLVDMMTLDYTARAKIDYGAIRLYGSAGFAIAVFMMGRISDTAWGLSSTFLLSAIVLVIGSVVLRQISEVEAPRPTAVAPFAWSAVWNKQFVAFLIGGMLVFGPIYANNYYFGIYVTSIGGSTTLIGTLFLVAVLCEIPFMKVAHQIVFRLGTVNVLAGAAFISALRNGWLAFEPPLWVVWLLAIVQGLVVGLLIPVALQFVRSLVSLNVTSTAIGVYMAVTSGLATAGFNQLSGIIIEYDSIIGVFWMYTAVSFAGAILFLGLRRFHRKG
ncbi:MFS transporter [Exiguobacterium aurantiacum]|uniref:Probable 3-phenylpropionic acid transporter n=1 Tax=Exiguobacterium aurantiacum TaxID=33987 RepID=A0A377FTA4_9BACL|nr:MFS transporter [Exiguobacterium aurantiacum]STO07685.1 Probable 3-phenylpropionic acid transporter [Exiguobacterium aurantiacum]